MSTRFNKSVAPGIDCTPPNNGTITNAAINLAACALSSLAIPTACFAILLYNNTWFMNGDFNVSIVEPNGVFFNASFSILLLNIKSKLPCVAYVKFAELSNTSLIYCSLVIPLDTSSNGLACIVVIAEAIAAWYLFMFSVQLWSTISLSLSLPHLPSLSVLECSTDVE